MYGLPFRLVYREFVDNRIINIDYHSQLELKKNDPFRLLQLFFSQFSEHSIPPLFQFWKYLDEILSDRLILFQIQGNCQPKLLATTKNLVIASPQKLILDKFPNPH
ncbi:hypothetical protein QJ48_33995 [Paenibacillus sp. A3]|nr:hypothetical protein QJ48_33995 [Paenibacillus sp. A3]